MSQSKSQEKAFGRIQVYDHSIEDWIYLRAPEIGDLKISAQTGDHNGWLICDGRSLSKREYPKLYSVLGVSFGGTANNFNLPDARGRVLGCVGEGIGLTRRSMGARVGEEAHALSVNELPVHSHTYIRQDGTQRIAAAGGGSLTAADEITKEEQTSPAGGGERFNIMQPTLFAGSAFIFAANLC